MLCAVSVVRISERGFFSATEAFQLNEVRRNVGREVFAAAAQIAQPVRYLVFREVFEHQPVVFNGTQKALTAVDGFSPRFFGFVE